MTALITKALSSGFTSSQVVKMLIKQFPQYKEQIEKALAIGYGADKILQQITKNKKGQPTISNEFLTESEKQAKLERENKGTRNKIAGATALAAGTAAATAFMPGAAQAALGGIQGILGGSQPAQPQGPQSTPSPMEQTPGQTIGAQVQAPGGVPNVPAPPQEQQPQIPQVDSQAIVKQMGLEGQIENLRKAGNDPEAIAAGVEASMRPEQKKWLQSQTQAPIFEVIKDYLSKQEIKQPEQEINLPDKEIQQEEFPPINQKESKTGDTVITDSGEIGTVKGISGHLALIEENGKLKQIPIEQLRGQPEAIRNSKVIFDPSTISEEDRSAALGFVLPLPDKMSIIDIFHNGKPYIYKRKDGKPFDESIIRRIVDGTDIPLTKGDTFMGAYNPEKGDSRGSANHKELVSRAQKAGDPDDPTKDLIFEEIDDSYIHGYYKEFMNILRSFTKAYAAKPKKPKKGKA